MANIEPGRMREFIKIEKRSSLYEKGVKRETFSDYFSTKAELLDLYGSEKYSAYQAKLENSIKFKCRMCNSLKILIGNTKDYRVIWNNEPYNLIFVDSINNSRSEIILQVQRIT